MARKLSLDETMLNNQRKRYVPDPSPMSRTVESGSDIYLSVTCPAGGARADTGDTNIGAKHSELDTGSDFDDSLTYRSGYKARSHNDAARGKPKCDQIGDKSTTSICSLKCTVHSELVISSYCKYHKVFCCQDCVCIDHRTCKNVSVEDAASASDIGKLAQQAVSCVAKQTEGLTELVTHMHNYQNILKKNMKETVRVIKETTHKWISRITKLERATLAEVDKFYEEQLEATTADDRTCKTMMDTLTEKSKTLKLHSEETSLDAFVTTKRVYRLTRKFDKVRRNVRESIRIATLTFLPNSHLENKMCSEHMLGEVRTQCEYPYMPKSVSVRAAGEVSSWAKGDAMDDTCITGVERFPDGRVIIADSGNKKLKLLNHDGAVASCLDVQDSPWDIAVVNCSRALVTIPKLQVVQIIDITDGELVNGNFIRMDYECPGIVASGETEIIVSFYDGISAAGIMMVDYNDEVVRRLDNYNSGADTFSRPNYICQNQNKELLYVSDCDKGVLIIKSSDFSIISSYTNVALLKCPLGLTLLSDGFIYVCGSQSNNIVQLSGDVTHTGGTIRAKEVVSAKDGLSLPQNVCCLNDDAMLIVSLDKQYKMLMFHLKTVAVLNHFTTK